MDYITKPTSRKELRKFSKVFRFLFGVTDDNSPFPVLNALEILPDVFKGTTLSIVEDNDLLPNVPAFTPVVERSFGNNEIPPCKSVEWQAKALCGEVMMPYDATAKMSSREIVTVYHVSKASANYRKKY